MSVAIARAFIIIGVVIVILSAWVVVMGLLSA